MNDFYVYCLFRPWNGEPCYIGKGRGDRRARHAHMGAKHYNRRLANIFKRGLEVPVVILAEDLDEATAFEYEIAWIAALGRADLKLGPLCNCTDGGDGVTGMRHTAASRKAIGAANLGRKLPPAHLKACRAAQNRPEVKAVMSRNSRRWHASLSDGERQAVNSKISTAISEWHARRTDAERQAMADKIRITLAATRARKAAECQG